MQRDFDEVGYEMHMLFYCAHCNALRAEHSELFIEGNRLHEFLTHHPLFVAKLSTECSTLRICKWATPNRCLYNLLHYHGS